jgi:hypothetical protein
MRLLALGDPVHRAVDAVVQGIGDVVGALAARLRCERADVLRGDRAVPAPALAHKALHAGGTQILKRPGGVYDGIAPPGHRAMFSARFCLLFRRRLSRGGYEK